MISSDMIRLLLLHEYKLHHSVDEAIQNMNTAWGHEFIPPEKIIEWFQKFESDDPMFYTGTSEEASQINDSCGKLEGNIPLTIGNLSSSSSSSSFFETDSSNDELSDKDVLPDSTSQVSSQLFHWLKFGSSPKKNNDPRLALLLCCSNMSHRGIGGRLLPCEPGSTQYEKDLYRGQRRRPWLVFRFGTDTAEVTDEIFSQYVNKVKKYLLKAGILLDEDDQYLMFLSRVKSTQEGITKLEDELEAALKKRDQSYEQGPLSEPIAIYLLDISDSIPPRLDALISRLGTRLISFFKLEPFEILDHYKEEDYTELRKWCEEFAKSVISGENLPESLAVPQPIVEKEMLFGGKKTISKKVKQKDDRNERFLADLKKVEERENMYHSHQQQNGTGDFAIAPPPGLEGLSNYRAPVNLNAPPGLDVNQQASSSNSYGPPPGLHLHNPPGIEIRPPPGLLPNVPGGSDLSGPLDFDESSSDDDLNSKQPIIDFEKIRLIVRDYELDKLLPGGELRSNNDVLARTLCEEEVFRRFETPFGRALENLNMMLVVNYAVSTTRRDVIEYVDRLLKTCFEKRYPDRLMQMFIIPRLIRDSLDMTHKDLFFEITRLYGNMCNKQPKVIREDTQVCWKNFWKESEKVTAMLKRHYDVRNVEENDDLCIRVQRYIVEVLRATEREKAEREEEERRRRYRDERIQDENRIPPNRYRDEEDYRSQQSSSKGSGMDKNRRNHDQIEEVHRIDEERRRRAEDVIERGVQRRDPVMPPAPLDFADSDSDWSDDDEKSRTESHAVQEREVSKVRRPDVDPERQRYEEERRRKEEYEREARYREMERRRVEEEEELKRKYMKEREFEEQRRREEDMKRYGENRREEKDFDESSDEALSIDGTTTPTPVCDSQVGTSESVSRENERNSNDFQEPLQHVKNIDETEPQAYMYTKEVAKTAQVVQDEFVPLWQKGEKMDPPEDFRVLTAIPTLADYHHPVEPYLRRIRDDGIYSSPEHYLDVQFRLMREDLVSPLRDGVDIYRNNGTSRNNRIADGLNSDILINVVTRIEGKQVTQKDGSELRYACLHPDSLRKLQAERKEVKDSGLALISSDNFVNDVHLVKIHDSMPKTRNSTDRKKNDYTSMESYISFVVLEENKESPLKKNKVYKVAEGSSYLPSYQYVLENIKKINRFIAIPFERYIVYGKKIIYRPAFHRQVKDEEQIHDEMRIEKYYGEVRSVAKAKMIAMGKDSSSEEDDDCANQFGFINKKRKKKTKKEENICEERRQMNEPIFNRPIGIESPEDGDKIKIEDQWYKVSTLLSEFHPSYMDESQRVAFCNTFNREFSIIQGPPGTGKTHIGVHIVKTMLLNRQHWRITSPIVVICYTNSAVDQFLERILDMIDYCSELCLDNVPKMVRIGGKSQSEKLQKAGVLREQVCRNFRTNIPPDVLQRLNSSFKDRGKAAEALGTLSYGLYASRNKIGSFLLMSSVMDEPFKREIMAWAVTHKDSRDQVLSIDEAFACWLLEKDFGERRSGSIPSNSFGPLRHTSAPTMDESDSEFEDSDDDGSGNNEEILSRVLQRMNIACSGQDVIEGMDTSEEDEEVWLTDSPWEIGGNPRNVIIFSSSDKDLGGRHFVPLDSMIVDQLAEEKDMILNAKPLKAEELKDIKSVFSLTRPKRWALYLYWCAVLRKRICENLPVAIENYKKACEKTMRMQEESDAEIMKNALIIGATTTGCSRIRPLLERIKPKILIVEEAAEVLEAHILSALVPSLEQVVMIGDHQQLRPSPATYELGTTYGMEISMFERLVVRGLPYSQLKKQHRMNVDIADLIVRPSFYPSVIDADNVKEYPDVEGMATNLFLWSHRSKEHSVDQVSWINDQECRMVVYLVAHLLKQSYQAKDITIITTYSAQRNELIKDLANKFGVDNGPQVETVDSYQGRENKIVLVSLVRSHRGENVYSGIGFLSTVNRICVALTRAQHGMYVIGNAAYLARQSLLWEQVMKSLVTKDMISYDLRLKCTTHKNEVIVGSPEDFAVVSPEGGCDQFCEMKKDCGHICPRNCHPNVEKEHHVSFCREMCLKHCSREEYRHRCKKRCNEECGACSEYVDLVLSCGHTITAPCWNLEKSKCDKLCSTVLKCGHNCTQKCGNLCSTEEQCKEKVDLKLKCGHVRVLQCNFLSTYEGNIECVERCEKTIMGCDHQCDKMCGQPCTVQCKKEIAVDLRCGHSTQVECCEVDSDEEFSVDEEKFPCKTPVRKILEPCKHKGMVPCSEKADTKNCIETCREIVEKCGHECRDSCGRCYTTQNHCCQERCKKILNCGHECSSKCGEPCAPCTSYCTTSCPHKLCGMGRTGFPGYGRVCSQLCVMCTESCSNRCAHRSCSKRCYEKCDVSPCNERCSNQLRCKHACLGLCGEICPEICATCRLKDYEECIEVLKEKGLKKVLKLIQVPDCKHTFPVKFLDEHVKDQMKHNQNLTCPKERCTKRLDGVLRYSQYCKKKVIDDNLNRQKLLVSVDKNAHIKTLKRLVFCAEPESKQLQMASSDRVLKFFSAIGVMGSQMHGIISKTDNLSKLPFYDEISRCLFALKHILIRMVLIKHHLQTHKLPVRFENIVKQSYEDLLIFVRHTDIVQETIEHVRNYWKDEMVGAVLPKTLCNIARLTIGLQLMVVWRKLREDKTDLSEAVARSLQSSLDLFLRMDERKQYLETMLKCEKLIGEAVPSIKEKPEYLSWEKLDLHEF